MCAAPPPYFAALEATELAAAEFIRTFEATARVLGYRVERLEYAPPALSVLRFPARHMAVILAGCWYLGHQCVLGQQRVALPSGEVSLAPLRKAAYRSRQSIADRLAMESYSPTITHWQCSRWSVTRTMQFLRDLMEPSGEWRPLI